METALRTRLKDTAAVTAIVGTRIDWGVRPQGKALPALTLNLISDPRPQHMGGMQATRQTRVQVDCFAETFKAAHDLREAVIDALIPAGTVAGQVFLRSFIDGVRDTTEVTDTATVFRSSIDFQITHISA